MRLEQENDDLAHELVTSKSALRNDLDQVSLVSLGRNKTLVTFRARTKLLSEQSHQGLLCA